MQLVFVSKTRLFEQPSNASSNYPQPTHEMRDEVLSSAGAQDMDTSGCQVSDLDVIEFYWENDHLDLGAVFRTGLDTPFPPSTIIKFEIGSMAESRF